MTLAEVLRHSARFHYRCPVFRSGVRPAGQPAEAAAGRRASSSPTPPRSGHSTPRSRRRWRRSSRRLPHAWTRPARHPGVHCLPREVWRRVWSYTRQERVNKEIRRRTDVVGSSRTAAPSSASPAPSWPSRTANGPRPAAAFIQHSPGPAGAPAWTVRKFAERVSLRPLIAGVCALVGNAAKAAPPSSSA